MSATESITHPGIVDHTSGNSIFVKVLAKSACSSCHAKGMCNIAEVEEKVIEVKKDPKRELSVGDEVTVGMHKSLGGKAVFLGYILPFLLLIGVLLLVLFVSGNEGLAGLSALLILIPYYWLLYILRDKLKRTFSFRIEG
ncbi:MAG: Fis family transcriptional regulator [Bacteroidetes bacterium]|nr:MAG: Fis family transcriptional regulator [Bacteroidota bacterium]